MSFARAYSYHMPRQASAEDTSKVYESAPPLLLSPSHRSRLAAQTPSNRVKQQPFNASSPLLLDVGMPLQPMEPLTIDAATPHAAHSSDPKHMSYVDSLLATPRPGYTPTQYISPGNWRIFMSNFRTLFTLAWPVILSYLLQFSQGIVNLVFLGHISPEALAAAALGNMVPSQQPNIDSTHNCCAHSHLTHLPACCSCDLFVSMPTSPATLWLSVSPPLSTLCALKRMARVH